MKGTDFVNAQNPKNPYQFTGQEFIDAGDLGWYDYGARWYDPAVGRMMQVDPMASSYDSWSTYTYGMDNPVRYVDPTGMFSVDFNQDDFGGSDISGDFDWLQYMNDKSSMNGTMGISKGGPVTDPPPKGAKENPFTLATATVTAEKGGGSSNEPSVGEVIKDVFRTTWTFGALEPKTDVVKAVMQLPLPIGSIGKAGAAKSLVGNRSLVDQGLKLVKLNKNKNSVTLKTVTKQIRFDLAGKAHAGVATPHKQIYNKNFYKGVVRSISRASKEAQPMTQQEIRTIRKYLENLPK